MRDRDNTTRTGAKDPWGREEGLSHSGTWKRGRTRTQSRGGNVTAEACEGWSKLEAEQCMPGAGLSWESSRKAPSDILALKPYWGKLNVRNFRGGDGNVGIIDARLAPLPYPTSW